MYANVVWNAVVCVVGRDGHCDTDVVGSIVCPDAVNGYYYIFESMVYVDVVIISVCLRLYNS